MSGYTHDGSFQQYATANAVQAAHIPKNCDLAVRGPVVFLMKPVRKLSRPVNLSTDMFTYPFGLHHKKHQYDTVGSPKKTHHFVESELLHEFRQYSDSSYDNYRSPVLSCPLQGTQRLSD
ncbi:hypothetical protein B0I73DRAFT_138609 [Yarrowia lipolytica]|nr:hypothetical protein B0I73DRAFT_138609 [Yarrowia lipolytica]